MNEIKNAENSILIRKNTGLSVIENSIGLSRKLIYNGADILFNKAFYLLNSRNAINKNLNFCELIENDKLYYKKYEFSYDAKSNDDYIKALELFTEAIKLKQDYKIAYNFRGICNFRLRNYLSAISDFNRCLEFDIEFTEAYYYRGFANDNFAEFTHNIDESTKKIHFNQAINDYFAVIKLDPKYSENVYSGIGLLYDNIYESTLKSL